MIFYLCMLSGIFLLFLGFVNCPFLKKRTVNNAPKDWPFSTLISPPHGIFQSYSKEDIYSTEGWKSDSDPD